ncbi:MAG: helix-turn-helix domain-containing protein [Candidatus Bathyarchaeota archaeon]|nr:helix-turn-helix domain-containing protein [Candidatus Bathyarchaeota archaeon]
MRRLILEVSDRELAKFGVDPATFQRIKSLELQHFLRQDKTEFAAIWKVEFKDPTTQVSAMLENQFLTEAQVLEQEKNGAYTVFLRGGPILSSVLESIDITNGYLFPPLEVRDGKVKISFLGNEKQVAKFLEGINNWGIRYKVILLAHADFSPNSPLSKLTEKQREILIAAYESGYYDVPRKINSEKLAEKLCITNSTLVEHLRKAEHRLLTHILAR